MNLDEYRPIPFYFLNTMESSDYTEATVNGAMKRLKEAGYGGIVLFNKPPDGFGEETYLENFWFEVTERFVIACRGLELELWINDGFNYPPGDAGGRIAAVRPDLKQLRIRPNSEGRLDIMETEWGFPAFEEPESSRLFIEFVYEEYFRRLGKYFGNGIAGFFSDADNRRVNSSTPRAMNYERYYPWSRDFSRIFTERFGYKIEERLSGLFSDEDPKVSHDYWLLCGELYQQWFANNHRWCREHGLKYTFHTSDTGPLNYSRCRRSSAFTEGAPLPLFGHSDMPGTDHEILALDGGTHYDGRLFYPAVTRGGGTEKMIQPRFADTRYDLRAKYAASAAILGGHDRVMCEMFAATNWGAAFDDLRRIAAWQIMQGVNFIVPHAVHHRFHGETKFFAPPEFLHNTLAPGLREFNDILARYCRAASAGEYVAELAVIDPTPELWRGRDTEKFFVFCDKLNRASTGYVIVSREEAEKFARSVDPLRDDFPEIPDNGISFSGGELAYMRRRYNGDEYLLAANIWSSETLRGNLRFGGKSREIELVPGEIAVIGGPFESFRSPERRDTVHRFTEKLSVAWEAPNPVPFETNLRFHAVTGLRLTLLIPECSAAETVSLNGGKLSDGVPARVFDDRYVRFEFSVDAGESVIRVARKAAFETPCLLTGDFDVELKTDQDYDHLVMRTYMLGIFAPRTETLTLSPRRRFLDPVRGWEQQGQPFYSGSVVYDLGKAELIPNMELNLPGFSGVAELLVEEQSFGTIAVAPFRFRLGKITGTHRLRLKVWNTMANRMERYAAPGGLRAAPELIAFTTTNITGENECGRF